MHGLGWDGIEGGGTGLDGSKKNLTKRSTELARNWSHLTMQYTSLRFHTSQLGGPSLPSRDVARWEDLSGDCFLKNIQASPREPAHQL